jgi:signal transduction histidine kinase
MLLGGIGQILFLASIEKRILIPLQHLNEGVVEIAKGNYGINVACEENSEVDMVIKSFNEMAKRLKEGEELKREYEENRKLLIANISHDLKTPITSIQGYIETMAYTEDLPKETIKKYNQIIYNNAGYMNKLIDDLFLFSKLDMQKLEFNFELINIENFMRDLMEEFQFELEDKNIHFSYESKITKELIVKIDRKRIHQVFRNIIGNAVKYAPTDGSKNVSNKETNIDVELYINNGFINIDIKDNGEGIPEEKLPYIFDRFYRIDYARTKDLMSTGLGLAISKELVDAHGGSIKAESKINEGTCFTITLPIEEGE